MKQHFTYSLRLLMIVVCTTLICWGVPSKICAAPAIPHTVTVTQTDGSTLEVLIHGDEFFNWRSTLDGKPIVAVEGYYYYAIYSEDGELSASDIRVDGSNALSTRSSLPEFDIQSIAQKVSTKNRMNWASQKANTTQSTTRSSSDNLFVGEVSGLVILVEFTDVKFTIDTPNTAFTNQLNQEGYAVEGATGSANEYFKACSSGQFDGQFDVYGPYTLAHDQAYYGTNNVYGSDQNASEMIREAVQLAKADGVDFSKYDRDKNNLIDNTFVYYAGYAEAAGAAAETVWPHLGYVYPVEDAGNGYYVNMYACTSELRGNSGELIAGIGTFCHEFSHSLGLYDHYDTDYEENGTSYGLQNFDIMSSGNYNNNGNTPPLYNALELEMLGWNTPTTITQEMSIVQPAFDATQKAIYKIETENEGEYFLIENRTNTEIVWDSFLASSGLMITHIDRSASTQSKWDLNQPNNDPTHECFKIVSAANLPLNTYDNLTKALYPISTNNAFTPNSTPKAVSWAGVDLPWGINNITSGSNESISYDIEKSQSKLLSGTVTNAVTSLPVAGATITLSSQGTTYTTTTLSSGWYEIDVPLGLTYTLTASLEGYEQYSQEVTLLEALTLNFTLKSRTTALGYHNNNGYRYYYMENTIFSGIQLPANMLEPYVDNKVDFIRFYTENSSTGKIYLYANNTQVVSLSYEANISGNDYWVSLDLSESDLKIEKETAYTLFISIKDATDGFYKIYIDENSSLTNKDYNLITTTPSNSNSWGTLYDNTEDTSNIKMEIQVTNEDKGSTSITSSTISHDAVVRIVGREIIIDETAEVSLLRLYTPSGTLVMQQTQPQTYTSVAGLPQGIYLLTIETPQGSTTQKVVIK